MFTEVFLSVVLKEKHFLFYQLTDLKIWLKKNKTGISRGFLKQATFAHKKHEIELRVLDIITHRLIQNRSE